jgi:hypothetical protein
MPVLVEANSVIVRRDAIDARMQGGWEEFQRLAPAENLCADEDIVRVGFDEIEAAAEFVGLLLARGLRYGAGSKKTTSPRSLSSLVRPNRRRSVRQATGSSTRTSYRPAPAGECSAAD